MLYDIEFIEAHYRIVTTRDERNFWDYSTFLPAEVFNSLCYIMYIMCILACTSYCDAVSLPVPPPRQVYRPLHPSSRCQRNAPSINAPPATWTHPSMYRCNQQTCYVHLIVCFTANTARTHGMHIKYNVTHAAGCSHSIRSLYLLQGCSHSIRSMYSHMLCCSLCSRPCTSDLFHYNYFLMCTPDPF